MKKIKHFYLQLKIKNKVLIISLISGFFPLLLLGIFGYSQINELLHRREQEVLEETMNHAILHLDYKMNAYHNSLNYVLLDHNLNTELTNSFTNNYEMYLFFRDTLEPLFFNTLSLNRDFAGITVYTDQKINRYDRFLRPLSDIEVNDWYEQIQGTTRPVYYVSENPDSLNLAAELYTHAKDTTNIINLSIYYHALFDSLYSLYEDQYAVFIFDTNQQLIFDFQKNTQSDKAYIDPASIPDFLTDALFNQNYIFKQDRIPSTDWSIMLMRPKHTINQSMVSIAVTFFIVTLTSLFLLVLLVYLFSRIIVRPLESLALNMKAIDSGNFNVTVTTNSNDEISTLIHIFKKMVQRVEHLINEVYISKIEKQEYELKALQAQINPHFFYNALSLINSKAILADQVDISLMTQHLSTFYRTTLNRGKDYITIKEELENVRSYLKIQHMMHNQSFDYYLNIDDQLLAYQMPNLTLQPLVENAIHHGLDHKEIGLKGIVSIDGKLDHDQIVFIVSDNGKGMTQEQVNQILTIKTKGYGVRNVHNRIQLNYGNAFGLDYVSYLNKGTHVTVRLPLIKNES
ncbi:sensor histidine kinase [Amphibacillus cookii]|uniref:sensor histidine kinase n=1 Tax=Amphibacillus cookii TaxID=767787 RepID=UPI001959FF01|nr:histidine kinase [Amphibacillus cookii]MBM7541234.1 two-component system sensor histidine kinase YesM [Amphibacillus cookii]